MSSPSASPIASPADPPLLLLLLLSSSQSLDELDDELDDDDDDDDELDDDELPRTSLRAAPSLPACAAPDRPSMPRANTAKIVSQRNFTL